MAQKVQVLLVDDLDGGEADETVTFALDGKTYEIDLTTENADKLRGCSSRTRRAAAAPVAGPPAAVAAPRRRGGGSQDTAKIRAWAKENGYEVNDRGRVPAEHPRGVREGPRLTGPRPRSRIRWQRSRARPPASDR